MSQAYLQLSVHEDGKLLLVINTPQGLLQYTWLPYRVSVARYLDDILIAAPTESEHSLVLEQVLQRKQGE